MLVRIECHRLAVCLDVFPSCIHVGERTLALDHLEMHQFAGRIIDIDEQGALLPAILKPPVLRAVDLDQLAPAIPAIARLVGTRAPRVTVLPKPSAIIHLRNVSCEMVILCRSARYSAASVGPKSL